MSEAGQDEKASLLTPQETRMKWYSAFHYPLRKLGEGESHRYTENWGFYYEIFGPIVDYVIFPEASPKLRKLISLFYERDFYHVRGDRLEEPVDKLCSFKPLEGRKVLEVGGGFGRLLYLLGADCVCFDPMATETRDIRRLKVIKEPLTPENFEDLVGDEKFDITYSRLVLDWGSRLAPSGKRIYSDDFTTTCQRMLWMIAEVTEEGGISIHVGGSVPHSDEILQAIGFKLEARISANMKEPETLSPGDIYIFRRMGKGKNA